jgi:hypothetical protein
MHSAVTPPKPWDFHQRVNDPTVPLRSMRSRARCIHLAMIAYFLLPLVGCITPPFLVGLPDVCPTAGPETILTLLPRLPCGKLLISLILALAAGCTILPPP